MTRRILLSAFACDPCFGSDEEVGWQWANQLSLRGNDVTVVTRTAHQNSIETHIALTGQCVGVKFIYLDLEGVHAILRRVNRRNHVYYYIWQWHAYKAVKKIHGVLPFDVIHHVTWVSFRQPTFMGMLGALTYFGPVAGGDEIPTGYTKSFSFRQKAAEAVRRLANGFVRFDPLMRMTYRQANKVFFTSTGHLARVPDSVRKKAQVELAIGLAREESKRSTSLTRYGSRLLFVGRCIGLKGMDIGLQIFSQIYKLRPDVTLTIVGDGSDRKRWQAAAKRLGIDGAVEWRGWLPKDTVLDLYKEFDLLFYPSLRDSGGFVVLEALQNGLPVVCFKLGGPGVVVNDTCGMAVEANDDIAFTVQSFAASVLATLDRVRTDATLSAFCRKRANMFTWDALIERVYDDTPKEKNK